MSLLQNKTLFNSCERLLLGTLQGNERVSNTQSKGERVKIPLLPNKVGKKSGTMTMVTTPSTCYMHGSKNILKVDQYSVLVGENSNKAVL